MSDCHSSTSPPDRSPSSRAIIVHPLFLFKRRHPIYQCFGAGKQYEKFHYVPIPGIPIPFVVQQNFVSSKEHLGSVLWQAGISAARFITSYLSNSNSNSNSNKNLGGEQQHIKVQESSILEQQQQQQQQRPLRILELGCGTAALPSQCAALLCGAQTYMTDLPEVLKWAKQNAKTNLANQLAWKQKRRRQGSGGGQTIIPPPITRLPPRKLSANLSAMVLRWGEAADLEAIQQALQDDDDDGNDGEDNLHSYYFDIVVAADCCYATNDNPDLQSKLLETLKGLLSNGRTKVFFSYQLRTGEEKKFLEQVLPAVFPNYMVEEVNHRTGASVMDSEVYSMLWFRPKEDVGGEH